MTISLKRRREIAQEAKEFHEAWRLACACGKAGDTAMANFLLNSVKLSKPSPEEAAWIIRQAQKRMIELVVSDHKRRALH